MRFTHLRLENWRNFKQVDVDLPERVFIIGPNASGKSNLLDVFRFLRDLVRPGGGFGKSVEDRGGVSQLRCLAARRYPNVVIEVAVGDNDEPVWRYHLSIAQDNQGRAFVKGESVFNGQEQVLGRTDDSNDEDSETLRQTHIEQVTANKKFRDLAQFFASVQYRHIVPQLVRDTERYKGRENDPYGSDFLIEVARAKEQTRISRLKKINEGLSSVVPQFSRLEFKRDDSGAAHLIAFYKHWRPDPAKQNEQSLSDGTLRLLGLLWSFLEGSGPLLLEEPELSLHPAVVRILPQVFWRLHRRTKRQVLVSTHSTDLLSDSGIAPEEVLLLLPDDEGTRVQRAAEILEVIALLEGGFTIGDAVVQRTSPRNAMQLSMFGE